MKSETMQCHLYFWKKSHEWGVKPFHFLCSNCILCHKNIFLCLALRLSRNHHQNSFSSFFLYHRNPFTLRFRAPSLSACRQNYYKMKLAMNKRHGWQNQTSRHFSLQVERINQHLFIVSCSYSRSLSSLAHSTLAIEIYQNM